MKLDHSFSNTRNIKKFVNKDRIIGYVISSGRVVPIYDAEFHIRLRRGRKTTLHIMSTYVLGAPLNGFFYEDPAGTRLALIAEHAIEALREHKRRPRDASKSKKPQKASE